MLEVLKVSGLTKIYRSGEGIFDIGFTLHKGEMYGFLGVDGAGKTTTIRSILGLVKPKAGKIAFMGKEQGRFSRMSMLKNIGYLPEDFDFYRGFNGWEFLNMTGIGKKVDIKYRDAVLQGLGLTGESLKEKIWYYDPEVRQKLAIIAALQHRPALLLLDEPSLNLDTLAQHQLYDLLSDFSREGGAVFLASQSMPEVERLCRRVAIIRRGKILSVETVDYLRQKAVYNITVDMDPPLTLEMLRDLSVESSRRAGRSVHFQAARNVDLLMRELLNLGTVNDVEIERGQLEEVFKIFYKEGKDGDHA